MSTSDDEFDIILENRIKVDDIRSYRQDFDWEIEEERHEFFCQKLDPSIRNWKGQYPDLREIFRPEEIERLLTDSINYIKRGYFELGKRFIGFVAHSGYKDEPPVDEDGTPSSHRTTPVHHASRILFSIMDTVVYELFKIYERFDVNYTDECGHTHFHIACQFGCDDVVQKFLELGQVDPNLLAPKSIDPPLHLALAGGHKQVVALLLRHGANPNLVNAAGSTPLHVICLSSDDDDLAKMLFELSDENYLPVRVDAWSKFGNAPLHLALQSGKKKLAELLLRRDADPNLTNKDGSAPLHLICERKYNDDVAELFFKISDEKPRSVRVDARDKNGWTPLQLAVANLLPKTVNVLLNHGADLSGFVFPNEGYFVEGLRAQGMENQSNFKLKLASSSMIIVEHLEKKGYELNESDALTIMKFFAKYGLFEKSVNPVQRWRQNKFGYEDEEMKKLIIIPDLSLYDLVRLRPEEAAKRLTFMDYYEFARSQPIIPRHSGKDSGVHLIEKLSRGFFRHWALEFFAQLTHYELPIVCCEKIFDRLMNEDLWHICLAATYQSS